MRLALLCALPHAMKCRCQGLCASDVNVAVLLRQQVSSHSSASSIAFPWRYSGVPWLSNLIDAVSLHRAAVYERLGKHAEALDDYDEAISLDNTLAETHLARCARLRLTQ